MLDALPEGTQTRTAPVRALQSALAVLTLACSAGAQSEPAPTLRVVPPSEVVLQERQSAEISLPGAPSPLIVKFSAKSSDSRCPQNVQCVWAGEVLVLLTYSGEASGELSLKLPGTEAAPASGDAGRYRITLLEVTPVPIHGEPQSEPTRVKLGVVVRP